MLLCSFLLASVGWAMAQEADTPTFIGTDEDVAAFKSYMGIDGDWQIIYGNGFPITISKSENATADNQVTISFLGEGAPESIQIAGNTQAIVFGGSKEKDLNGNTSITMNSGKVGYLIGGGWGTYGKSSANPKTANVQDVTINVTGGIVGLIYSGGLYSANVDDIHLTFKNATASHIYCGGFDQGQTTNTIETSWDSSVNHVTSSTLEMENATVNGYLFLGGGQGYSYSKTVNATISNSTLRGGVLGTGSNGRSDKVTAVLDNVTFEQAGGSSMMIEIAALNRGVVGDVDMTFKGCTFPSNTNIYKCYAGATYQYDGKSTVRLGKVTMTFTDNMNTPTVGISSGLDDANVTINGAPVEIAAFDAGNSITNKDFTIATGKIWAFNNGLTIADNVTLTNNGTLEVSVSTADQLVAAIKAGANKVTMAAGYYELSSQLTINKAITLEGAVDSDGAPTTTLKRTSAWSGTNESTKHMVCITAPEATVSNLIIDGNNLTSGVTGSTNEGSGIQVYENNTNVNLNNVTVKNMLAAGLIVNSAKVSLTNFHTEGNAWGGVNVDKKATNNPQLTVGTGCSFAEINKIWNESKVADAVTFVSSIKSAWTKTPLNNVDYWTNSVLSIGAKQNFNFTDTELTPVYANGNAVTISDAGENKVRIAVDANTEDYLVLDDAKNVVVFGGSRDKAITGNTSVKMVNGTVNSIFGGGYGLTESFSADVSGTTNVNIEGGNVAIHVYSGSYGFGKIEKGVINISGNDTKVRRLQAGGAAVGSGITLVDNYEAAKNAVKEVVITIQEATIIEGMGTGGGFGYAYTGTSNVTVTNATLGGFYGTLSNGFADNITATLDGCTLKKLISYFEFATINRGEVKNATFTIKNCSFENLNDITAGVGPIEGWDDSDTNGTPTPYVKGNLVWKFENNKSDVPVMVFGPGLMEAHITVDGAPVLMREFKQVKVPNVKEYTINEGKTWTFNNGLELTSDVTLTQTGTLVVNGTMKVATAEQAAQAILKGNAAVIDASSLTADAVLTKMNSVEDKVSQLKAMQIKTSDNAYIFTDNEMALNYLANNAKVLALVEGTYQLNKAKQIDIQLVTNDEQNPLTASDVEAGKRLATSVLKGGFAQTTGENPVIVVGSFAWSNPDTEVSADGSYEVVFTPLDIRYATATANVSVKAIKYYTIVTGTSANGTVTITNANAANKYTTGTVLNLSYTPDTHYEVAADQPSTFTVGTDNATITGEFKIKQHKVNIASVANGSVTVKSGSTAITDGTLVDEGTLLNITASPTDGYTLASLTNNGVAIRNNALVVDAAVSLAATFSRLLQTNATVTVSTMENGKLLLLDQSGNSINKGASVAKNSTLTVIAIPNEGYVLSGNITATGATYSENLKVWTVDDNAVFSASFVQEEFDLVASSNGAIIEAKKGETTVTKAKVGETLTLTATISDNDKKVASLIVDGKEIANGGSFVVSGKPIIVANVVEKAKIGFNDLTQTVVYDGTQKQFIVRSIPAGLTGFTVTYNETPINAANHDKKEYTVTISREADDTYQAVNETGKLIIEAAPSKGFKAPTWDGSQWNNGADGTFTDNGQGDGFRNVIFTPNDGNFKSVQFSVAKSTTGLTPILLTNSGLRATAALTITGQDHGYVTLWNGTEQITSTSFIYPGQTLTVKAMPNAGYSSLATWTINGVAVANPCNETSITLVNDANTIDVAFSSKDTPTLPSLSSTATYTYSGSAIYPIIENSFGLTGWNVLVKSGDLVIDEPTVAGTYQVYVTRDEDEMYASVDGTTAIGSYTIQPRVITAAELTSLTATSIILGQTLASSTISGTAPAAGSFSWNTPSMVAEKSTEDQGKSVAYPISFIPADVHNYKVADGVSLTLSVPFYTVGASAPEIAVRHITFAPAANGTFVVKVNGVAVETGAQVSAGDKVVVETTPNSGYSASVSYTGITNGVVDASGNVAVTVTFTQNSTPVIPGGGGGTVDPDPVIPTVSNPVVAERTATTAVITWEKVSGATSYKLFLYAKKTDSTPLKTYEFDKDGKLKATTISFTLNGLEEGKSYYIETAAYNALGTLLVKKSVELSATPTGIEAISEGSQLYTVKGAIVVAPAEPLRVAIYSVTGQTLFNDEVSYLTQVPAKAGIYVVVIQKGNERITEKVFVK